MISVFANRKRLIRSPFKELPGSTGRRFQSQDADAVKGIREKTPSFGNRSEITSQYYYPSLGLSHAISAARSMGEKQNAEVISERILGTRSL